MLRYQTVRPLVALLLVSTLGLGGLSACREETPAMKKANLGRALAERGAVDKAIATLQASIKLDPELVMGYELLGEALEAAGRYPEAIDAYQETVRRDPVRDTAYVSLGCLLLADGDNMDAAEAALNSALAINQTHAGAHACLGAVYLDRRDFMAAIESSSTAVSLNPQSVQAHLNLGIAFSETGRIDEARAEIERTISLAVNNKLLVSQAKSLLDALSHPEMDAAEHS